MIFPLLSPLITFSLVAHLSNCQTIHNPSSMSGYDIWSNILSEDTIGTEPSVLIKISVYRIQ